MLRALFTEPDICPLMKPTLQLCHKKIDHYQTIAVDFYLEA